MIKTKKTVEKKMTIDKLAIMVQEGFMATAKKEDLLSLAERVDRVESRLDKLESSIESRFDKVFLELKEIRKDINNNEINTREDITKLEIRVAKLEKKIKIV